MKRPGALPGYFLAQVRLKLGQNMPTAAASFEPWTLRLGSWTGGSQGGPRSEGARAAGPTAQRLLSEISQSRLAQAADVCRHLTLHSVDLLLKDLAASLAAGPVTDARSEACGTDTDGKKDCGTRTCLGCARLTSVPAGDFFCAAHRTTEASTKETFPTGAEATDQSAQGLNSANMDVSETLLTATTGTGKRTDAPTSTSPELKAKLARVQHQLSPTSRPPELSPIA